LATALSGLGAAHLSVLVFALEGSGDGFGAIAPPNSYGAAPFSVRKNPPIVMQLAQDAGLTTDGDDGWFIPEFPWDPTHSFLFWTASRFPSGVRVPLLIEPATRHPQTGQFLEDPTLPSVRAGGSDIIQPSLPLQSPTRILTLNLGAG
jgi:hypothetical protein